MPGDGSVAQDAELPRPKAGHIVRSMVAATAISSTAAAPMHRTEYVDGDPDGCARCGERADLHE